MSMEPVLVVVAMVMTGVLGTLFGVWASEREIERLHNRILELRRDLHTAQLDQIIDKIERER